MGIITSLDTGTSIAIQKKFTAAGGKTIDYDRQIVGGTGSVYIAFDGNQVGRIQALGVIAGMKAKGTYKRTGVLAQLWGGPTDANAFWFKSGNDDILNPVFKAKKVTKGPAKFVPEWDAKNAQTIFEQFLVKTNNRIDGVVGANDNIAGAVVATLKAKGLDPIALSGQDATVQGVQNIISGWQTNTVYKYVPDEANAAIAAAVALYKGKKPPVELDAAEREQEAADAGDPGVLDHQGELHPALPGQVPEAERGVLRGVQAVLQVVVLAAVEARLARLHRSSRRARSLVSDTPLLEIRDLSKTFGSVQALTDVDFEVRVGEVMALVGDNGAGKSTLIKCIAGIHGYDSGQILFDGERGSHPRAEGLGEARDRGRLPGSRALRQPRRRPEHVPRPRGSGRPVPAQRAGHGAAHGRRRSRAFGSRRSSRSGRPSRPSPVASASPSRSRAP